MVVLLFRDIKSAEFGILNYLRRYVGIFMKTIPGKSVTPTPFPKKKRGKTKKMRGFRKKLEIFFK